MGRFKEALDRFLGRRKRGEGVFIERVYGNREDLPRHRVRAYIKGSEIRAEIEIEQPKNPVTLKFPEGTRIWFSGEEGYRELEPNEVVFAEWCEFYGEGMTTGATTEGKTFKALNEPAEITPLKDLTKD